MHDDGFSLTVSIPVAEWTRINHRLRYIEAALIQMLRGGRRLKEWFTLADLLALNLPGLPTTRQGLSRRAAQEDWPRRIGAGKGGERYEFHFSGLPKRAFEGLIDGIVAAPLRSDDEPDAPTIQRAPSAPRTRVVANAEPVWMLPLMRVLRGGRKMTLEQVMRELPKRLPFGVSCPTRDEVQITLRRLGLSA